MRKRKAALGRRAVQQGESMSDRVRGSGQFAAKAVRGGRKKGTAGNRPQKGDPGILWDSGVLTNTYRTGCGRL